MWGERAPLEGAPTRGGGQREPPLRTGADSDVPPLPVRITAVGSAPQAALRTLHKKRAHSLLKFRPAGPPGKVASHGYTPWATHSQTAARTASLPSDSPPSPDATPLLNACPPQVYLSFHFPSRSLAPFVLNACRIPFLFLSLPLLIWLCPWSQAYQIYLESLLMIPHLHHLIISFRPVFMYLGQEFFSTTGCRSIQSLSYKDYARDSH